MIIQAFFGEAQTGLGFQFYNESGTLLGSRTTTGISSLPEVGAYVASATPPTGAVGVFWSSDSTEASEDLRDSLVLDSTDQLLLTSLYIPQEGPAIIVPAPADDVDLCRVYVNVMDLEGEAAEGVAIVIELATGATKTEKSIERERVSMITDSDGHAEIDLVRTDVMVPSGQTYLVTCAALGLDKKVMTLEADLYDLSDLIE